MTDKTQPTVHAEIAAPISADLRGIDAASAKSAPITFMVEDRACKWAWEQVQQDVGTKEWTAGDSGNFFGFFLWGWNYRGQYETQRSAAPPAPAAVAVPDEGAMFEAWVRTHEDAHGAFDDWSARAGWEARAALAAGAALASDTESVLIDGIAYEVPAAVAGELLSLHLDLLAAAPAQAVAVPTGEEVLQLRMLVLDAVCALETVPVTVSCGLDPSESAKASAENIERKLASIPAQEHATQLAGQGQDVRQELVANVTVTQQSRKQIRVEYDWLDHDWQPGEYQLFVARAAQGGAA